MTKGNPIRIQQVKNGYIIEPTNDWKDPGIASSLDEVMVFNKLEDLNAWLNLHFDREHTKDD